MQYFRHNLGPPQAAFPETQTNHSILKATVIQRVHLGDKNMTSNRLLGTPKSVN